MRIAPLVLIVLLLTAPALVAAPWSTAPAVTRDGDKVKIAFAVAAPTDVEVAVLGAEGKVVRHLAAGVLGGTKPPPAPLKEGLAQSLEWDGKDDFGKAAPAGPVKVRVRAGTGFKFGRFIGEDPANVGAIDSVAADEQGNLYVMGYGGDANQAHMVMRVFDAEGRYLREVLPFPANLSPAAMKDVARWDEERSSFLPQQLKNLNPDFYNGERHGCLHLVSASETEGVFLTDGARVAKLDSRGGVAEAKFGSLALWPPKAGLPNTGDGPTYLRASPDGKYLYLSGPYSTKTFYGHEADPRFPPGQVYRMEVAGGALAPFARRPTVGEHPAKAGITWTSPRIAFPQNYSVPHGPIHDVAADKAGHVFVADQDNACVAVYDEAGKELSKIEVEYPDVLAVHPRTGAVYVLTKEIKGYHQYRKTLAKFSGWKDPKQVALLDLGVDAGAMPQMTLAAGKEKTVLWLSGLGAPLVAVEDKGDALEKRTTAFVPRADVPVDWNRLAVDHDRDEVYISNGTTRVWRYDGRTGEGGVLRKDGKDFLANDLAVGYDGLLYVRVSGKWDGSSADYSGPFWRMDRSLAPAPFSGTGTHVLSPYIYSRYGIGFAERGIGAGPRGESYVSFMYKWVAYAVAGFGPDGKPLPGAYLKGAFPAEKPEERKKYPAGLESAVIGPLPMANAGIRVDLAGNVYVGVLYWPKEAALPPGFTMDRMWTDTVGCVVKFKAGAGGEMTDADDAQRATGFNGVIEAYPGLAPFSKAGIGGNTCCVCRGPRFDLDRYGRLALPNAVTCSVWLLDNAGNRIAEIGKYGNFDSGYVNANTKDGAAGKPTVATPEVPLAWPTGAGFSEEHLYINDTYSRRVVRVDRTWQAEAVCEGK